MTTDAEFRSKVCQIVSDTQGRFGDDHGVPDSYVAADGFDEIADLAQAAPTPDVDPWRQLATRLEDLHRDAVNTLNASEGSAEYAAIEASAYGHVLHIMDTLVPPERS